MSLRGDEAGMRITTWGCMSFLPPSLSLSCHVETMMTTTGTDECGVNRLETGACEQITNDGVW